MGIVQQRKPILAREVGIHGRVVEQLRVLGFLRNHASTGKLLRPVAHHTVPLVVYEFAGKPQTSRPCCVREVLLVAVAHVGIGDAGALVLYVKRAERRNRV